MGTEKDFTLILLGILQGKPGKRVGLTGMGGTPNHKWLRLVVALATAFISGTDQERTNWTKAVLDGLAEQRRHHMMVGGANEFCSASHWAWWQNAMAGLWVVAYRFKIQEILVEIRAWWIREISLENLCCTPQGAVVLPGPRSHIPANMADQRAQRNQGRALIMASIGAKNGRDQELVDLVTKVRLPEDVRAGAPSLDRVGLWALTLLPAGEIAVVARAARDHPEYPTPRNSLTIERTTHGLVASFEHCDGLIPSYWAWVNFATGTELYGAKADWPKGLVGGARPEDLPVPAVPPGDADQGGMKGARKAILKGEVG